MQKVEGLAERRDARKYASSLLKMGYIRHTVNKITFSEQCYYVFGDYTGHNLLKGKFFNFKSSLYSRYYAEACKE